MRRASTPSPTYLTPRDVTRHSAHTAPTTSTIKGTCLTGEREIEILSHSPVRIKRSALMLPHDTCEELEAWECVVLVKLV